MSTRELSAGRSLSPEELAVGNEVGRMRGGDLVPMDDGDGQDDTVDIPIRVIRRGYVHQLSSVLGEKKTVGELLSIIHDDVGSVGQRSMDIFKDTESGDDVSVVVRAASQELSSYYKQSVDIANATNAALCVELLVRAIERNYELDSGRAEPLNMIWPEVAFAGLPVSVRVERFEMLRVAEAKESMWKFLKLVRETSVPQYDLMYYFGTVVLLNKNGQTPLLSLMQALTRSQVASNAWWMSISKRDPVQWVCNKLDECGFSHHGDNVQSSTRQTLEKQKLRVAVAMFMINVQRFKRLRGVRGRCSGPMVNVTWSDIVSANREAIASAPPFEEVVSTPMKKTPQFRGYPTKSSRTATKKRKEGAGLVAEAASLGSEKGDGEGDGVERIAETPCPSAKRMKMSSEEVDSGRSDGDDKVDSEGGIANVIGNVGTSRVVDGAVVVSTKGVVGERSSDSTQMEADGVTSNVVPDSRLEVGSDKEPTEELAASTTQMEADGVTMNVVPDSRLEVGSDKEPTEELAASTTQMEADGVTMNVVPDSRLEVGSDKEPTEEPAASTEGVAGCSDTVGDGASKRAGDAEDDGDNMTDMSSGKDSTGRIVVEKEIVDRFSGGKDGVLRTVPTEAGRTVKGRTKLPSKRGDENSRLEDHRAPAKVQGKSDGSLVGRRAVSGDEESSVDGDCMVVDRAGRAADDSAKPDGEYKQDDRIDDVGMVDEEEEEEEGSIDDDKVYRTGGTNWLCIAIEGVKKMANDRYGKRLVRRLYQFVRGAENRGVDISKYGLSQLPLNIHELPGLVGRVIAVANCGGTESSDTLDQFRREYMLANGSTIWGEKAESGVCAEFAGYGTDWDSQWSSRKADIPVTARGEFWGVMGYDDVYLRRFARMASGVGMSSELWKSGCIVHGAGSRSGWSVNIRGYDILRVIRDGGASSVDEGCRPSYLAVFIVKPESVDGRSLLLLMEKENRMNRAEKKVLEEKLFGICEMVVLHQGDMLFVPAGYAVDTFAVTDVAVERVRSSGCCGVLGSVGGWKENLGKIIDGGASDGASDGFSIVDALRELAAFTEMIYRIECDEESGDTGGKVVGNTCKGVMDWCLEKLESVCSGVRDGAMG